ncbi:hypothetical protein C5167_040404 [Papaver somniferum]|uniref:Mechanosensitive ion channel protein n=1 Tax=Papaver somniferum TaxID=3469 RepID=A0A4Y7IHC0_PAPSO|nr:mechanosensitive ion channel protein 6-like [Papaver somniferum]RZC47466.1 hypothetical protein C5167_040404 [Papaver somniferum]
MESLKQSLKSFGSGGKNKHSSSSSSAPLEKQPILFQQDNTGSVRKEVLIKIDGGGDDESSHKGNRIWRRSSYDYKNGNSGRGGNNEGTSLSAIAGEEFNFIQEQQQKQQKQSQRLRDDPPLKLIDQFLDLQKASGEISLDMDLEMDELVNEHKNNTIKEKPYEPPPKTSFPTASPTVIIKTAPQAIPLSSVPLPLRRRSIDNYQINLQQTKNNQNRESPHFGGAGGTDEVIRCTSNDTFNRNSNTSYKRNSKITRTKTMKSRLMDPPADKVRSGRVPAKSAQLRSGFIGGKSLRLIKEEDEEEDPFAVEDIPDKYKKSKFFSPLVILQWVSLILILGALICSLTIHELSKRRLWALPLWKWELIIFVLICGRLVSGWGIRIVVFFIERNFILRKRVLYFVYGLRKAVQNCLWLGLVLLAWQYLFDKKVARDVIKDRTNIPVYITKFLILFLVSTLLWLVKTLLVKVLASSFHVSTYFDRIQDSLFTQYVIGTLSCPPMIQILRNQEEEEQVMAEVRNLQNAGATMPADLRETAFPPMKSGKVIGSGRIQNSSKFKSGIRASGNNTPSKKDEGISIDELHRLNQKNISAWKMKRLMKIIRHGVITTLDEKIQDSCDCNEEESATTIRSEFEAKSAARKIFNNVAKPQSKFIHLEDIMRFMGEEEAEKTMNQFEGGMETNRVSKKSLKHWVINAFRERRALALTLDDTKTVVNQLHRMVNVVVCILIGIIGVLILEIATTKFLVLISSQLLLVAFMFGNTCKMAFEAIIFLFVMHPFDVGDRCEVEDVQMVVEEMNILTTVFLRYDNQKIIYPNSVLATKPISNLYRSPDMGDSIDFCVHVSTPVEKISTMKKRLTAYIESKREHWYPSPMIVVRDVDDLNRLKISVWLCHRMNHQDMGERWVRRALVVEEMIKVLRELDIEYRMLPLDVNVRNMPGLSSQRVPSIWTVSNNY